MIFEATFTYTNTAMEKINFSPTDSLVTIDNKLEDGSVVKINLLISAKEVRVVGKVLELAVIVVVVEVVLGGVVVVVEVVVVGLIVFAGIFSSVVVVNLSVVVDIGLVDVDVETVVESIKVITFLFVCPRFFVFVFDFIKSGLAPAGTDGFSLGLSHFAASASHS
jgi:hypothetical protein